MNALLLRLYPWNWLPYLLLGGWLAWALADALVPVVAGEAKFVSRADDTVVVHLVGNKLRECRYIGILAYSRVSGGLNRDTIITRIDLPAVGSSKPRGAFDMGKWSIRPVTGATHVSVYVQHACDADDLRTTKLGEIRL